MDDRPQHPVAEVSMAHVAAGNLSTNQEVVQYSLASANEQVSSD